MTRGKNRPQKERAEAVGIAVVTSIAEASRQTGIPESTVRQWYDLPEFAELRRRNKDEVANEWWGVVQKGVRRVATLLDNAEDVQKVATATAIVTDKMLLLRGEATVRTESTLLKGRSDHEQQLLADLINAELERRADSDPAGDQAADPVEESAATEAGPA
jgi:hypothetical protein